MYKLISKLDKARPTDTLITTDNLIWQDSELNINQLNLSTLTSTILFKDIDCQALHIVQAKEGIIIIDIKNQLHYEASSKSIYDKLHTFSIAPLISKTHIWVTKNDKKEAYHGIFDSNSRFDKKLIHKNNI